ncbi:hypothetical protein LIER_43149 [Lithospermum erythrorhizon]|uniref:Uncharacterized protein n=1 Tax=Lithospermum erythrorhizon TaxID=34254 RepID=A0AAV3PKB2_LITER
MAEAAEANVLIVVGILLFIIGCACAFSRNRKRNKKNAILDIERRPRDGHMVIIRGVALAEDEQEKKKREAITDAQALADMMEAAGEVEQVCCSGGGSDGRQATAGEADQGCCCGGGDGGGCGGGCGGGGD